MKVNEVVEGEDYFFGYNPYLMYNAYQNYGSRVPVRTNYRHSTPSRRPTTPSRRTTNPSRRTTTSSRRTTIPSRRTTTPSRRTSTPSRSSRTTQSRRSRFGK